MGYILALIGLGLMVGFAGGGSAIGTSITGSSVLGMLRKRPDQFGPGMVLTAVPGTQGLYGFVGFFLYKAMLSPDLTILQGAIFLGAGLMMGTACFISGIFQGKVCANGINDRRYFTAECNEISLEYLNKNNGKETDQERTDESELQILTAYHTPG